MKKAEPLVERIDFNKLRRDLQTLMEEVDRRLASEFDAFRRRCGTAATRR